MNEQVVIMQERQLRDLITEIITEVVNNSFENMEPTSPYMNKKEACEYIRKSNNTLDKLIRNENFPVIKKGHTYFFNKNDINNWMKNN